MCTSSRNGAATWRSSSCTGASRPRSHSLRPISYRPSDRRTRAPQSVSSAEQPVGGGQRRARALGDLGEGEPRARRRRRRRGWPARARSPIDPGCRCARPSAPLSPSGSLGLGSLAPRPYRPGMTGTTSARAGSHLPARTCREPAELRTPVAYAELPEHRAARTAAHARRPAAAADRGHRPGARRGPGHGRRTPT